MKPDTPRLTATIIKITGIDGVGDFEDMSMIIQTAPIGQHRLAIMMYEHTALSHQFARSFGNKRFQGPEPNDLMFNVVLHHDAGWAEFDRNPVTDQATGLPFNYVCAD
jgi:Protein of unknown function (DUF3891)